jgi:hypothetical protein
MQVPREKNAPTDLQCLLPVRERKVVPMCLEKVELKVLAPDLQLISDFARVSHSWVSVSLIMHDCSKKCTLNTSAASRMRREFEGPFSFNTLSKNCH